MILGQREHPKSFNITESWLSDSFLSLGYLYQKNKPNILFTTHIFGIIFSQSLTFVILSKHHGFSSQCNLLLISGIMGQTV